MTESDGEDWNLIRPNPIGAETPPELSTGHPADDQLLRQIAARVRMDLPREVKHYLYVPDEESARLAARPLVAAGCQTEIIAPDHTGEPYLVTATLRRVLTPGLVRRGRKLCERIVSLLPGAEYDGWEVGISTDEYLTPGP